ncbi:MAG: DUF3299 domain-containing protein [Gemmatimonadaceae bacterium]|nr:DUF3299 domain-containing protein [Gemmatimonadaceae bacterium]
MSTIRPRSLALWLLIGSCAVAGSVRPRGNPAAFVAPSIPDHSPAGPTRNNHTPDVITIDWRLLRGLNFRTGAVSDTLKWLDGRTVRLPGFVVPLDDLDERAKEFLLVPYFGACVHLPPPPPNQLVHATLRSEVPVGLFHPVWIEGVLQVARYNSPYGVAGFRMRVHRVSSYQDN